MTLMLSVAARAALVGIGFGWVSPVFAGWEYNETARPTKRRGSYPTPAKPAKPAASKPAPVAEDPAEAAPPVDSRVQVFGRPTPNVSAEDYARMMKEDADSARGEAASESAAENPVVAEPEAREIVEVPPAPTEDSRLDTEFEALRDRMRSRRVAEAEGETANDAEPAPAPKRSAKTKAARRPSPKATPRKQPAYIPPPPMETEIITPQKPTGKRVKGAAEESATEPEEPRGDEVNEAFPYTHLLPSPFNLPQGTAVFGTTLAYGVFDFLQFSTNVARDIQGQWNAGAKVPLVEWPTFVASAFVDYQTYNPHRFDETNPDQSVKRWQPGLVTGYEITPDVAFFLGGNFSFGDEAPKVVTTSGYLKGAQLNMEWSWLYNPSTSRLGNNAIAFGLKYDFTYALFGLGLTHHWRNFELGVHYTFADRSRFLPIAGFSVSSRF